MAEMTPAWTAFITGLAEAGGWMARDQDLPVGAMLACASVESGWGTSRIYKATKNPFSLQKWPRIPFPHCPDTFWSDTMVKEGPPPEFKKAPFNMADGPADAVLQWCEWIVHYGRADGPGAFEPPGAPRSDNPAAIARAEELLKYRGSSADFCLRLPLVGFGENTTPALARKSGERYRTRLIDFSLNSFD